MSTIKKSDLLANPKLLSLADPQSAMAAGIPLPEKSATESGSSQRSTLKDAFAQLTPTQKRNLRGTEAKQHAIFVAWLNRHQIPHIHAPTSRKVHDLPLGWPDFTIFKGSIAHRGGTSLALLIEIKVPGGVLSWEQKQWMNLLDILILPNAYQAIGATSAFCDIQLSVYRPHPDLNL